jgi:spore coat polysaccharide biosynthesis protein SpsF (cytidylyltransferase family)
MGKSLLHHLLERLELSELIDSIVVATGPGPENEEIRDETIKWGFDCPYIKREEDNVLGRYVDAARLYQGDIIVRITGDCPLVDPSLVDRVIDASYGKDFASNVVHRTFPRGLDVEVMPFPTLWGLDKILALDHPDREHVCSFIYKQKASFNIASITDKEDNSDFIWCVDDEEDLERVSEYLRWGILPYQEVLRRIKDGSGFSISDREGDATWGFGPIDPEDGTDEGLTPFAERDEEWLQRKYWSIANEEANAEDV